MKKENHLLTEYISAQKKSYKKTHKKTKVSAAIFAALLISGSGALQAADLYWVCSAGEEWDSYPNASTNPCWATTDGGVGTVRRPSSGDSIYFTNNSSTNNRVSYFNGSTTDLFTSLNIWGGNTLVQTRQQTLSIVNESIGSVLLGDGAIEVSNGSHLVSGTLGMGIGAFSTPTLPNSPAILIRSKGSITVTNAGTVNANNLNIAGSGKGTLNINNGGVVLGNEVVVANDATGIGSITVDGIGSSWTVAANHYHPAVPSYFGNSGSAAYYDGGGIVLGNAGAATLTITNGGEVNNLDTIMGQSATGSAAVVVDGSGSRFNSYQGITVGVAGSADITIRNGGIINSLFTTLGSQASGSGSINIDGSGSRLVNTADLIIGDFGTGNLAISTGGEASNISATIGSGVGSSGSATVSGAGSSWANNGNLEIGLNGTASLQIRDGAQVSSQNSFVGRNFQGAGTVTVNGTGSVWQNSRSLYVGSAGSATLNIENGGTLNNTTGYIGSEFSSNASVSVSGNASNWSNSNSLYIGGRRLVQGGTGQLNISNNATVNVTNALQVWDNSTVNLSRGTLNVGTILGNGQLNFNSGTINIANDLLLQANGALNNLNLSAIKNLSVGGITSIAADDILTLDGGTFSTGSLMANGYFDFKRGTFNLTNNDFSVSSSGILGSLVQLNQGQVMNVSRNTGVFNGSVLSINNAQFSTDTLLNGGAINIQGSAAKITANTTINNGEISLNGAFATLDGGTLFNNGLVSGQGRINVTLSNNSAGEIALYRGDTLRLTGTGNTNSGVINLYGGSARFDNDLSNETSGVINGNGTLIANGGLTNNGAMRFSGESTSIVGNVENLGSITVTGNATATFYNDVIHNGSEILVREGSAAVYFGDVSGAGAFTGTGLNFFEGTLSVGNSPTLSTFAGDFALGDTAITFMELGGMVRGDEYDAIDVAGTASLAGTLQVDWFDLGLGEGLFTGNIGDSFDLFYADTIFGEFDLLTLAILDDTMQWDLQYILDDFGLDIVRLNINAVSAVPVPASIWLFVSGIVGLVGFSRRQV